MCQIWGLVDLVFKLYILVMIVYAVLSWVPSLRGRWSDYVAMLVEPVLMHRLLFRPSFLAEIRDRGWDSAALEVRSRCLELAPKPGFDIDLDVPAAATA